MTDPTVVLVSVGADSAALIDEIERKGLRVVSCPFAEAEEAIERERPLLVVLHGSRGAVELSTMLEDAEDPPQVAVVAARAELGTLMGLNRDIVVSLLATELTEKTVAARLEAVVRQRAKTLGLSLNLAARRASLGPRPSLPRPPPSTRTGSESKPQNLVLEAPTPDLHAPSRPKAPAPPLEDRRGPAPAPRLSGGTAIGLPSPGRPDAGPPPRRPPPRDPLPPMPAPAPLADDLAASLLLSDIPEPEPPKSRPLAAPPRPAPPRPAPPKPPIEPDDSAFGSDAPTAVISLTPSVIESLSPHEAFEAPWPIAPAAPPVPRFDPSDLLAESGLDDSVGPDLKAALALSGPVLGAPAPAHPAMPVSGSSATGTGLPEHATPAMAPELPPPSSGTLGLKPPPLPDDDDDDLALPLLRPNQALDTSNEDFTTTMLTEVTMPAIPGSLAAEALAEARLRSEPNHPIPEPPPELADAEEDRATVTNAISPMAPGAAAFPPIAAVPLAPLPRPAESRPRSPLVEEEAPPKRSKAGWIAGVAVVAALGGASAYVKWGMPKPQRPTVAKEPEAPVAAANAVPPPAPVAEASAAPPTDAPAPEANDNPDDPNAAPPSDAAPAAEAPATEEPAPVAAAPTEPPPSEAAPAEGPADGEAPAATAPSAPAASTEPAVLVDDPFATPDANLPGCDQLAPGAGPATSDPVTEASTHWSAARKSIVKGDVEAASKAMCLAVAINPQSPAVEGLARLYTLAHSPKQALIWIEKAIQQAPSNRELLNLRGDAKSQLGRQDEASLDWLEAMGIAPDETKRRVNQAAEYVNLARAERSRIDLAKAEQFYRRALGFEETNLVALTGMAEVLLARKLYDQAGSFAVKALGVFEPVPEAYLVLGDVALAKNDPARARAAFERALAIRPDFWAAKTRIRDLPK